MSTACAVGTGPVSRAVRAAARVRNTAISLRAEAAARSGGRVAGEGETREGEEREGMRRVGLSAAW
ncbi:hypothetical protein Sspor_27280 [Streptomyces spororaveus]|uniref:Uncharacterized protein n=1 Tax=Streptomyces spororaveus TaxID=284039 RepID=A0ABQ3T9W1_9ACTN|nr:hypothetical protein Sspor_27280 [Streptomyces spororaveus]